MALDDSSNTRARRRVDAVAFLRLPVQYAILLWIRLTQQMQITTSLMVA
jgi:hypothetical protein